MSKDDNKKINSKEKISDDVEIIKISSLRKTIAKKMIIAKTIIPETTLIDEVDIDKLVDLRKKIQPLAQEKNVKLTYMCFIAKAVSLALQEFPLFNASFDDEKDEIILKKKINLGIAIDTKSGLIAPNIKNIAELTIIELAQKIQQIVQKTIDQKLELEDIQKGTFTLSNYGSIGALYGTPIVNHPELAILGIGKILKKPMVKNEEIYIANVLHLSITVDHRIIDGANAVRFLNKITSLLNDTTILENHIF
ncbi:dihydrolipoamide acetyltransferase family protein [Candidatus Phytoplasma pini]|uniref:dihydrolipoamide acetyltransferase family protein n=1 Tax=Candidatus Phytoplasma pini TaxID=267362 RepID=UPI001FEAE4B6|nr:dihydrolipoamide acetyltransferase family protein [Candidatus Phytoplasma pini]